MNSNTYQPNELYQTLILSLNKSENRTLRTIEYSLIRNAQIKKQIEVLIKRKEENNLSWLCNLVSIDILAINYTSLKLSKNRSYYKTVEGKYKKLLTNIEKAQEKNKSDFIKNLKFKSNEFPELFTREKLEDFLNDHYIKVQKKLIEEIKAAEISECIRKEDISIKRNLKGYFYLTSIFTAGYFNKKQLLSMNEIKKLFEVSNDKVPVCQKVVDKYQKQGISIINKMPLLRDFSTNNLFDKLSNPIQTSLVDSEGLKFTGRPAIFGLCDYLHSLMEKKKHDDLKFILILLLTIKYEVDILKSDKEIETIFEADIEGIYFKCLNKNKESVKNSRKVYLIKYLGPEILSKHLSSVL